MKIGGILTNSGHFSIGNSGISKPVTATAQDLANTGTLDIVGGAGRATLDIGAAAPATLQGNVSLHSDALLEFAGGGITSIALGADLTLDGP